MSVFPVVDAETGEVLSDIQQSVQPDGKVKTEVELPAQGLHEEFEQVSENERRTTLKVLYYSYSRSE